MTRVQQSTATKTCDPADPNALPGCRAQGTTDECTACGDGVQQSTSGETCDPADPNAPAGCRAAGTTDECTFCDDGIVQSASGETCDPDDPNGPPTCRDAGTTDECTFCGDGVQQSTSGETCDPADPNALPGCRAQGTTDECTACGDGVQQSTSGETCDPADPNAAPGCRAQGTTDECTFCGDGVEQTDEICDQGASNCDDLTSELCTCSTTCCLKGTLGDFIWDDLNQDGVQDPNEPGIPNVTVAIEDCSGTVITTVPTDGTGFYEYNEFLCTEGGGKPEHQRGQHADEPGRLHDVADERWQRYDGQRLR